MAIELVVLLIDLVVAAVECLAGAEECHNQRFVVKNPLVFVVVRQKN